MTMVQYLLKAQSNSKTTTARWASAANLSSPEIVVIQWWFFTGTATHHHASVFNLQSVYRWVKHIKTILQSVYLWFNMKSICQHSGFLHKSFSIFFSALVNRNDTNFCAWQETSKCRGSRGEMSPFYRLPHCGSSGFTIPWQCLYLRF